VQTQRRWLQGLLQSKSSVKLVVAPSGLLGNPSLANTPVNDYAGSCANDWDCFPQAQISVLHMLSNATGCVIVLSGARSAREGAIACSWLLRRRLPCVVPDAVRLCR